MSATLHVLGAGSALPREGYGCAGYALRPAPNTPVTLLDCGPGSIRNLAGAGIAVEEVQRIVFSHYHLDHCLDLFALVFARRNPRFAPPPRLALYGPRGLERLVGEAPAALGRWATDPDCTVSEIAAPGGFTAGEMEFTCAPTGHTDHAVAWRVEFSDGANLTFTGDTGEARAVAELARGTDLLLAECSFPDEAAQEHHLTPGGAARLARDAGAKRLVLTHFYPETDPEAARTAAARIFDGPIEIARDGTVHRLG